MLKSTVVTPPIRLLALDIDGTLLNPHFQISEADMSALHRARELGIEILLVTGRRHDFAFPIAQQLGFDLWLISSNGAITRSLQGETFYRDMLPANICRQLCQVMLEFRGNTVLTFDKGGKGSIVLEHMNELENSIRRWLEKNMQYIEFVVPVEDSLITDPVQAMFCGPIGRMHQVLSALQGCHLVNDITILRTEYPVRDLSIVDILNKNCSKGHALERWAAYRGIPREQVMAIGDNYNDIEMLVFAGYPVIMGNASEDLRGRGWRVTLSNDQNGVAAALEPILAGAGVQA